MGKEEAKGHDITMHDKPDENHRRKVIASFQLVQQGSTIVFIALQGLTLYNLCGLLHKLKDQLF